MPDLLTHLAARTMGIAPMSQPLVQPMYATAPAPLVFEEVREIMLTPSPHAETQINATAATPEVTPELQAPRNTRLANPLQDNFNLAPATLFSGDNDRSQVSPDAQVILASPQLRPSQLRGGPGSPQMANSDDSIVPARTVPNRHSPFEIAAASHDSDPAIQSVRSAASSPQAPVIRVSIGRVEVRAQFPAPPPQLSPRRSQSSSITLEEYARERREGRR